MNELQIFQNEDFGEVRTIQEGDRVLFCGSDVAKALGYARPNDAISAHCRATVKRSTPISGKIQEINYISEGDVYRLIVHSKLPAAEKFERWVFDDVIPSIRRNGVYAIDEMLDNPDAMIAALNALKEERAQRKALEATCAVQTQQIAELQPKASYYDVVLNCKDLISVSKIAKDYGKSAMWLNNKLHELGIQFRQGDIWLLYQKYAREGYTSTKTHEYLGSDGANHAKVQTYWTQKGRLFIYEQLKADGILPLVEREAA